jgi:hypothetical protein
MESGIQLLLVLLFLLSSIKQTKGGNASAQQENHQDASGEGDKHLRAGVGVGIC